MNKIDRYLKYTIKDDLREKMVFLGGPRQVGKTTLALSFLTNGNINHPAYLNWDDDVSKEIIRKGELPPHERLLVLDEIHKFARWRNLVKGFYDKRRDRHSFLVTGSARLDYYSRGGDSLQGRYHYYRLHPFSLNELSKQSSGSDFKELMKFGGFPEPLFKASERTWKRWQRERLRRVIQEDLRDLEQVREISLIELLMEALPDRVGSPLSIASLSEDLSVNFRSIERWITIFENLYLVFRISPFGAAKIRAVKKERKLYFWDWSQNSSAGSRFENLVASQLLKYCHFIEDTEGDEMELRFLRDTDKREVDFVVLQNKRPLFAVECKTGEKKVSPHIWYFKDRTSIPMFYQVHTGTKDFVADSKIRVLPFWTFCQELKLP